MYVGKKHIIEKPHVEQVNYFLCEIVSYSVS